MNALPKAQINHDGPVLCTAFSGDGNTVFSGSCDKTAKMWQLGGSNQGQQIAAHDAPIKCIGAIQQANCIVTGSWDKTYVVEIQCHAYSYSPYIHSQINILRIYSNDVNIFK